jgi:hypothetical protein
MLAAAAAEALGAAASAVVPVGRLALADRLGPERDLVALPLPVDRLEQVVRVVRVVPVVPVVRVEPRVLAASVEAGLAVVRSAAVPLQRLPSRRSC